MAVGCGNPFGAYGFCDWLVSMSVTDSRAGGQTRGVASEEPVEDEGARAADLQEACGRGCETDERSLDRISHGGLVFIFVGSILGVASTANRRTIARQWHDWWKSQQTPKSSAIVALGTISSGSKPCWSQNISTSLIQT